MSLFSHSRAAVPLIALLLAAPALRAQNPVMEIPANPGRWTGTLRPVLMTSSVRNATGTESRFEGSVYIEPIRKVGIVDQYAITINISSSSGAAILEWGVSMGRCGTKLIMLEPINQLPQIQVRGGGDGDMIHEMNLDLNKNASYQVGLFVNGHLQQNMISCATMKYEDRVR